MLECPGDEVRSPVRHAPLTTLFDAPVGNYTAPGGGRAHQACLSILRMLTLLTFPTSATLATAASTTTTSPPDHYTLPRSGRTHPTSRGRTVSLPSSSNQIAHIQASGRRGSQPHATVPCCLYRLWYATIGTFAGGNCLSMISLISA
jgi:hypothetical protein